MLGCGAWESVRRFLLSINLQFHPGVPDGHHCCRRQGSARDKICQRPAQGHYRAHRTAGRRKEGDLGRYPRREEEKKTISDDIRDVYAEAKGNGFDVKALRAIVRLRKQDANERAEQETILETYMQALGML